MGSINCKLLISRNNTGRMFSKKTNNKSLVQTPNTGHLSSRRLKDSKFNPSDCDETILNYNRMHMNDSRLNDYLDKITKSKNLKVLNLSHNRIKSLGFSMLVDAIANHPSLDHLYLNSNLLDEDIFQTLKAKVKSLKGLKYINLHNNRGIKSKAKYKSFISLMKKYKIKIDLE